MRIHHLANAALRGILPFQHQLRRLKRAVRPYTDNEGNSHFCMTQGLEQLGALRDAGIRVKGADVLEFGSGWLPLIPLLYGLAGARRIVMTDITPLMDAETTRRAQTLIAGRIGEVAAVLGDSPDALLQRLREPFAPEYHAPWDAVAHPAEDVDIIFSRAVLEHVPEPEIRTFFAAFARILRPGGATCHIIDNSDHWQHKDRSLSRLNFLRYDERDILWRLAQVNAQSFQNRLRHGDYRRLLEAAGFEVIAALGEPDPTCLDDLRHLPLAPAFRPRDHRELAILTSTFVARRA
jgi:SAM-dependent methyltransferase